jgi:hypothetical protein
MEKEYTMSDLKKDIDRIDKDNKRDKIESRIQTIGLLLVFFFGIATIQQLTNKVKSKLG